MAKLNYAQVEVAIRNRENFQGNSCFGQWLGENYIVTSYWTTIAKVVQSPGGAVEWVNPDYYSKTTSRLQNIVRRAWGL